MTHHDDLDRQLTAWLDDPYTPPAPRYLGEVLERTRHTGQRPAWASLERWLPMTVITRPAMAPPLRMVWLLLITLLVLAIAAGGIIVGSRLLNATAVIPSAGAAVYAFDDSGDIYTVRADGTDLRQLTGGPALETTPVWSPDGTRLAYHVWQDGSDSVAIMDAGGGSRTILSTTSQPSPGCFGSAAWSPDGTSLIFPTTSSSCLPGSSEVLIVAADGSSPATRLLAPGQNSANSAAWSPDGTQIAFVGTEATGDTGLYVADVGTGGALAGGLEARRITEAGMDWYDSNISSVPQWSPDGTELTAMAGTNEMCNPATSGTWDAYVVKADGSGQRALSEDPADEFTPTWAPDGQQLAFLRIVGASELLNDGGWICTNAPWVIDADGTNERRLDGLGFDFGPSPLWSPDGTRIAGVYLDVTPAGEATAPGIYFVTVDGSSPLVIVPGGSFGSWQPVPAPLPPAPSFAPASPTP